MRQRKVQRAKRKGNLDDGLRDQERAPDFFEEDLGLGNWNVKGASTSFPWAGPFSSPVGGRTPHPGQRGILTYQNDSQDISQVLSVNNKNEITLKIQPCVGCRKS